MRKPASSSGAIANIAPANIVVIGASMGGNRSIMQLVSQIPPKMDAAFFVVLHLTEEGSHQYFAECLQEHTKMPCVIGEHNTLIEKGCIYLAPFNAHLLVKQDRMILGHGPPENRWRPSIDTLFRSAAASYGTHTTGIILTGMLDDGVSGMLAIRHSGGTCIVQDPADAEFGDMPRAVLNVLEPDHCIPLKEMGKVIQQALKKKATRKKKIPPEVIAEAKMAERTATAINDMEEISGHSVYSCPDCGGSLWHIQENGLSRYRCHIGHAYTEQNLAIKQSEQFEQSIWVALRLMEERKNLLLKMANDYRERGHISLLSRALQRAEAISVHIVRLKDMLFDD